MEPLLLHGTGKNGSFGGLTTLSDRDVVTGHDQ